MADSGKRKEGPGDGGSSAQQQNKKKKTGNAGKWKTAHQQAKMAVIKDSLPQPGDTGIWVTCARHQERKAGREVIELFEQYAEKMYGIKPEEEPVPEDVDDDDIEAAIQREVAALKTKKTPSDDDNQIFTLMKMNVDCLLFVKTRAPIEPVEFVRRICTDAREITQHDQMKCRYVNRFTPVTIMGKATEQGIVEVAKEGLTPYFDLSGKRPAEEANAETAEPSTDESGTAKTDLGSNKDAAAPTAVEESQPPKEYKPITYALRPTIRNHSKLKRDFVINEIAGLVNNEVHKVNLSNPDKVVLIDLYQAVCSMSVVDGDWDEFKKYNLCEIYNQALKNSSSSTAPQKEGE